MWGIVLLTFFVTGTRQISITEFSVPEAVESGSEVLLKCGYELKSNETGQALIVKWWFTPLDESDEDRVQLYQRIAGQPPEKTKNEIEIKGKDDILLRNVTPGSSGTYECEVSAVEDEKRQHDSLIVFTKGELVLNVTEVEDGPDEDEDNNDVLVSCEATNVAPFPDLVVTVNDEELASNDTILFNDNSTYDVITLLTLSKEQAADAVISCELFFRDANITHEQYKITQTFQPSSTEVTTTEVLEDASTTEATPGNRDIGTASNLLLVISIIFINVFAIQNYSL